MFLEWSADLDIGDPVVDSEHRYLVQLVNNLHEQHEKGEFKGGMARVFTHLAHYVRVHFQNEEALMTAVGYPDLESHREEHRSLLEKSMELSEEYLEGTDGITDQTLEFLKSWLVEHISKVDMKIRDHLGTDRPPELTSTPAFADPTGPEFKKCTLCGKTWATFQDLVDDKEKVLRGVQIDSTNHLYNMVLFNCSCDTTLAMFIKEFVPRTDIPFVIDEHREPGERPPYCLMESPDDRCLDKCACAYTRKIQEALGPEPGERS